MLPASRRGWLDERTENCILCSPMNPVCRPMLPLRLTLRSRSRSKILALLCLNLVNLSLQAATYTTPRALNVGDTYELRRDGWVNNSPSGYDGDVLPKTDAHDGLGRDNPYFRRHNVARAWPTDVGYWFTGPDQNAGEPDPAGEQWVDYAPPFEVLGQGRYQIDASYRWSATRASYPAVYRTHHALGTNEVLRDQRIGSPTLTVVYFTLGEFEMRPGSFVRVEDTGAESITFANMRFKLLAPVPSLRVSVADGWCAVRWPTNAVNYWLESTTELGPSSFWLPVFDPAVVEDDSWLVSIPVTDAPLFFRVVNP